MVECVSFFAKLVASGCGVPGSRVHEPVEQTKGVTVLRSTRHISLWLLGLGVALNMPIESGWAQTSKRKADRKAEQQAEKLDLAEAKKNLASGQESRVVGALDQVKQAPTLGKTLAPDVEVLLSKGTTLKITLNAISVLGALGEVKSSSVIAPYVKHRSPSVRQAAATALLRTKGPDAVEALRAALRSQDPAVRDVAARGLGDLKAKEALPDLFQSLDQRVFAAAVSIGKLCEPADCMKFMGQLKKLQLEVITKGTDEILFRPTSELDDATKLAVIEPIAALRTLPATDYLVAVYKRWPKDGSKSLKKKLGEIIEDNGGDLGDEK